MCLHKRKEKVVAGEGEDTGRTRTEIEICLWRFTIFRVHFLSLMPHFCCSISHSVFCLLKSPTLPSKKYIML